MNNLNLKKIKIFTILKIIKEFNYTDLLSKVLKGWKKLLESKETDPTKCKPYQFNFFSFKIMISVIKFLTKTGKIFLK